MGAGPYPTSEPEVRNLVDFITRHPNISCAITFHTWSGVLLRPHGTKSDDEMPAEDLWTFKKIGKKGTDLTGYPAISVFHEFRYHPKEVITGDFDGWAYEEQGLFSWTVEIWSPQRQAGIEEYEYIQWYREHQFEDDQKMLKWSDEVLEGKGYVDWYQVEHPQLGTIELGGWDFMYCWRNPPPQFLEKEVAPFSDWLIWQAGLSPQLATVAVKINQLGTETYHITFVVENTGWLPTYVTKKALEKKLTRGVIFEINLPDGATIKSGESRYVGDQLEGKSNHHQTATPWTMFAARMDSRSKYEWVINASNGSEITLIARHDRAGTIREQVILGQNS